MNVFLPPKELIFNVLIGIFEKQITLFIIWVIQSFFYSLLLFFCLFDNLTYNFLLEDSIFRKSDF